MAAFETLLHRYFEHPRFASLAQLQDAFFQRQAPPLSNAWHCWAEAEAARHAGDPRGALSWLAVGRDETAKIDDVVLAAERLATEAECWISLDEPRVAAHSVTLAWRHWSTLADGPTTAIVVESARALLGVLVEPHSPPPLSDAAILEAWLNDRFAQLFPRVAALAIGVYADHFQPEMCREVADKSVAWATRFAPSEKFGDVAELLIARLLLPLADAYDRCGELAECMAVLDDALARISKLPEEGEIAWIKGSLLFNRATQLCKRGRHRDAVAEYEAANALLASLGGREATMRGRHAICLARFQLGEREGLERELSALALEYEGILEPQANVKGKIAARQGLDRIYRLWLRLLVERFDPAETSAIDRILQLVFALKEEDGKFAGLWQRVSEAKGQKLLSEVTVMLERLERRHGCGAFVAEQVTSALLFISIGPGDAPLPERVILKLIEDADALPVLTLISRHRDAVDQLSDFTLPIQSGEDPGLLESGQGVWSLLGPDICRQLSHAQELMVCVDSQTDLRLLPIELFHDGQSFLGLTKDIMRVPSLRDLNLLLGPNRTNAAATHEAIVLRADDDLPRANAEARMAEESLRGLGIRPQTMRSPAQAEFLDALGKGLDVLHYVGHGLADGIGESLPLGPQQEISARALEGVYPAPTPIAILSACDVGRSRQLRSGHEQGFVTQLLRRGSPAVIAAIHLVPDEVASGFAETLYLFGAEPSLQQAVRATRAALAADGWHTAAWAALLLYGRPDVQLAAPHLAEAADWSTATIRYLLTGNGAQLQAALDLLANDLRLLPEVRTAIAHELMMLECGDPQHFQPARASALPGMETLPEEALTVRLVRTFGQIRHAAGKNGVQREQYVNAGINTALEIEAILGDTYLLCAIAVEIHSHTFRYLDDLKTPVLQASRRLRWLSNDRTALDHAHALLVNEET